MDDLEETLRNYGEKTQEWGFESPQTGLMYVTRNVLLFETMLAGAPEGTVPFTRFAPDWLPAPFDASTQ